MNKPAFVWLLLLVCCCWWPHSIYCQPVQQQASFERIDQEVRHLMNKGDIPGLSLVIISGGKPVIRNYGYANQDKKIPVTSHTLFQLASCSKAFTALAVLQLANEHRLDLDAPVSNYLPWLWASYKDSMVQISLRQLLHHTSGIPWKSISLIPRSNSPDALDKTVKKMVGIRLQKLPGLQYEYATVNYDILALIVQTVAHVPFEQYMNNRIFTRLQLPHTRIGVPPDGDIGTVGYKTGFFKPRPYEAPVYRGNNAAGYIISDADDIARWLLFQMGQTTSDLYPLAALSQQRDETVAPQGLQSYAMGWQVSLSGNGEIAHEGLNPNFTSYMAFRPKKQVGVAVVANASSNYTSLIGDQVMKLLNNEAIKNDTDPGDGNDRVYSVISLLVALYILFITGYLLVITAVIVTGKRKAQRVTLKLIRQLFFAMLATAPLLYGIYLFPATIGFTWNTVVVWTPVSFVTMVVLIAAAVGVSLLVYALLLFFPGQYEYRKQVPKIIAVSIVSGIANMALVIMITSSLNYTIALHYITFYFLTALMIYIYGRKYVQVNLIRITRGLVYETRMKLIEKIFSTSYQKFEKISKGRVYATLNDDAGVVGESTNVIVGFVTSLITTVGAFIYLATVTFWATALAIFLALGISALYFYMGKKTQIYFEQARNTQNVFMGLVNGMIDGFKEISLHRKKKIEYRNDIAQVTTEFKEKSSVADIKFIYTYLLGEASLIILLGVVAFGITRLFPDIGQYTIMTFIIVLLYLNGPMGVILNSVPSLMRLKVAWSRIQEFIHQIPANLDLDALPNASAGNIVQSIRAEGICFSYHNEPGTAHFSVGPIDLDIEKGQALFIIGGNGSGKTTLAKLLTGLYEPDSGQFFINNQQVRSAQLSEYFSAVFSPSHLFEKLYNIELKGKAAEVKKYLTLLGLVDKVEICSNQYSTIELSGGQRKRLALLQCYLENCPIFLFDEWSADQDPEYRRFFYRELLPEMKKKGKIIIAITHDDHYFDVADKILKMDMGKVEYVSNDFNIDTVLSH